MTAPVSVHDDASVFPPVSLGKAREVDAAGGVRLGAQDKRSPGAVLARSGSTGDLPLKGADTR